MKIYTTLFFFMYALASIAQTKKNSISLYTDIELEAENFTYYGVSYERLLSKNQGLQLFAGVSRQDNISLGIEYTYNRKILSNYLYLLAGAGVGIEYHSSESILGKKEYYLFRPLLGLSFNIPKTPLELFSVYKPKFDLKKFDTFDFSSMLFGLKYNF